MGHPFSSWTSEVVIQVQESQDAITKDVSASKSSSAIKLAYQFKNETRIENIAVRPNGNLLLTVVSEPVMYQLKPKSSRPEFLHQFPNVTSLTGIIETAPDIFIVVGGNWSTATFQATPGSFTIWSIDLNPRTPAVKMITTMPEAFALNGMTTLDGSPDIILMSDSALGAVWKLNVVTGEHGIALQSPLFTNSTGRGPLAINGLGTYRSAVYFLNSALKLYGRVPVTPDGSAAGEVQVLARAEKGVTAFDDFALDWEGNAWIATHSNMVTEISVEGRQRNFTSGADVPDMTQPTSIIFGRGSKEEENTLYIVTSGFKEIGGQVFRMRPCMI